MSVVMRKPTMLFLNRSDTNRAVQAQKMTKTLKFRISEEEGLYCPYSENKDTDQLLSYCEADLHLCFHICKLQIIGFLVMRLKCGNFGCVLSFENVHKNWLKKAYSKFLVTYS